ncbi:MAG: histidine phosphatase family protein [Flavobacteriales bacterium]|nr:histidine phosphatase family protein [Flavobacteriales bacterium]
MRTLYITRHAKSSWSDPRLDDFHRPLNERGLRDAPFMARVFRSRNEPLDLLVSSTAIRALSTARTFAAELGSPPEAIVEDRAMYLAELPALIKRVNQLPDSAARVMLFGHNPGLSDLVEYLGDGDLGELPTCAVVRIDLLIDSWAEASMGLGTVVWHDHPKQHPELR